MQNNRNGKWSVYWLATIANKTQKQHKLLNTKLKVNLLQTAINSPNVFSRDKHLTNTPLFQKGSIYKVKSRHALTHVKSYVINQQVSVQTLLCTCSQNMPLPLAHDTITKLNTQKSLKHKHPKVQHH